VGRYTRGHGLCWSGSEGVDAVMTCWEYETSSALDVNVSERGFALRATKVKLSAARSST
jgi:hypothetical protein